MKKLIVTAVLILSIVLMSYAKGRDEKKNLVKNLTTMQKAGTSAKALDKGSVKKIVFQFNETTVTTYVELERIECSVLPSRFR